jgi:serine/threonine protein kinase
MMTGQWCVFTSNRERLQTMEITFADGSVEAYEDDEFAFGAEGRVIRSKDGTHAVKIYHPDPARDAERLRRIDTLINELNPTRDDPYWASFFTWPEKRVTKPGIGFRMPFIEGLKTLENYYLRKAYQRLRPEERGWFIGRVACAIKLTSAAHRLAAMGLCYPDFSGKNIMVDPFEGRAVLIDCDSLTVPGKLSAVVGGTCTFRAPELVTGKVALPSVYTDRHALASILYHWLLLWDPLKGDKVFDTDPERDELLRYGEQALYIEHPTDQSNRASKQVYKASMLGPELERLLRLAFVDGLHNPHARPQPYQWRDALYHIYDQLIPCATPRCDWRFFVVPRPSSATRLACPSCGEQIKAPHSLPYISLFDHRRTSNPNEYSMDKSRAHYVVGWPGRNLFQWHTRPDVSAAYADPEHVPDTSPRAIFEFDQNANQWYLKNIGRDPMYYRGNGDAVGLWRQWPPNFSIPLIDGMTLQFGPAPYYRRASVSIEKVG